MMSNQEDSTAKAGGRPPGTRDTLHRGEVAATISLRKAIAKHGESHPVIQEGRATVLQLARKSRGRQNRLAAYRAIALLLKRFSAHPR